MSTLVPPLEPWERVTDLVASILAVDGLDLAAPLDLDHYNMFVDEPYRAPTFDRVGALGIVIGNTRAFWDCFVRAMRDDEALFASEDPVDTYVERTVRDCLLRVSFATDVRFSHEPPPRRVGMQRLAEASRLAPISASHLNVHPRYGPWIALRALVIVDVDGPGMTGESPSPCTHCNSACEPKMAKAMTTNHWEDWLAVRDACPVGVEHRYSEEQIRYHYTKDLDALRAFIAGSAVPKTNR